MTTTSMYQGLQGDKSTSRVLQPPGGGSSNIFGTESSTTRTAAPVRASAPPSNDIFGPATPTKQPGKPRENTASNIFGDKEEEKESQDLKKAEEDVTDRVPQVDDGPSPAQSAQAYAKRMQQGTGNPITGAGGDDKPATIVRVRQPPGGASSKLW